jgi:hypothetical protein
MMRGIPRSGMLVEGRRLLLETLRSKEHKLQSSAVASLQRRRGGLEYRQVSCCWCGACHAGRTATAIDRSLEDQHHCLTQSALQLFLFPLPSAPAILPC